MHTPPLTGIRVLSLAEQYPGPYATMLLADLGADVILVERPAKGDPTRRFPGLFNALGRNKRSVALDLKSLDGHKQFLDLVKTADVVLEGYRPGVVNRLKISADELKKINQNLIYVSISAFGQSGRNSNIAGHDLSIQGSVAMLNIEKGQEPHTALPSLPLADISSAMFAALSVVTALFDRQKGGQGSTIDISMQDCLLSWMSPFLFASINKIPPRPLPPTEPAYGIFLTKDNEQITLSIAGEEDMWKKLCNLLGLTKYQDHSESMRAESLGEINSHLRGLINHYTCAELTKIFTDNGIAFGPVQSLSNVANDDHIKDRCLFLKNTDDPKSMVYVAQPMKFSGWETKISRSVPALGEHNSELIKN